MAVRRWAGAIAVAVTVLAGCGEEETTTFTAQEFVDAANREGAGLTLGAQLETVGQPHEIFAATLAEEPADEHAAEEAGHEHGGAASLVIAQDEGAAIAEFDRCETAITLTCFRAWNVVVRVESGEPALLVRLQRAIQRLDTG